MNKIWEWCGWSWWENGQVWCYGAEPELTLDNLFKHAVPKVPRDLDIYLSRHWEKPDVFHCCIQCITRPFQPIFTEDKDPAQALAQAIEMVIDNRRED